MDSKKKPRRRIRVVYQRSSLVTKCVVLAALVITTAVVLALTISIRNHRAQEEENRQKAGKLEHENSVLEQGIKDAGSVEGDLNYAEKELDYIDGQAVIITPSTP